MYKTRQISHNAEEDDVETDQKRPTPLCVRTSVGTLSLATANRHFYKTTTLTQYHHHHHHHHHHVL